MHLAQACDLLQALLLLLGRIRMPTVSRDPVSEDSDRFAGESGADFRSGLRRRLILGLWLDGGSSTPSRAIRGIVLMEDVMFGSRTHGRPRVRWEGKGAGGKVWGEAAAATQSNTAGAVALVTTFLDSLAMIASKGAMLTRLGREFPM